VNAHQLHELIRAKERDFAPELVDRAIQLYESSESFSEANFRGSHIMVPLSTYFDPEQITRIAEAAADNGQVKHSFSLEQVVRALRRAGRMPTKDFDEVFASHGISIDSQQQTGEVL
jgi:hypothetical protein